MVLRPGAWSRRLLPLLLTLVVGAACVDRSAPVAQPVEVAPSLELLGQTDLGGGGFNANVTAFAGYAYMGTWGAGNACPATGIRIVDLADPAAPRVVATAAAIPGTSAENAIPVRMATPSFTGDLLAVGIQRCGGTGAAGVALVDVTDPRSPRDLAFFSTGSASRGVHELDVTVRPDGVFALLAVPGAERSGLGDFILLDITNPSAPRIRSGWGAGAGLGERDGRGCVRQIFDHSAHAGADGMRAYLSYWDAGAVILDISNPDQPRLLGRALEPGEEGSIHSVAEVGPNLIAVTEEVDNEPVPVRLNLGVHASGGDLQVSGCEVDATAVPLLRSGTLDAPLVYAGNGCAASSAMTPGTIILVDDAGCTLETKAARALASGATAVIVIQSGEAREVRSSGARLPMVTVGQDDGARLRALVETGSATVRLPSSRPWGAMRLWDVRDPAAPARVAVIRTADAEAFPPPFDGWFCVHNPLPVPNTNGRWLLASWYSDGVRLFDLRDPSAPREAAGFVPPAAPDPFRFLPAAPLVWGVALAGPDLVLASDMNGGLFVLRMRGAT